MSKSRIVYLDLLRILATFAIVIVHVCAQDWTSPPLDSTKWYIYNIGDSVCRWGVPIFLMISGALFLAPEKKLDIKKLYSKNIIRLVTAFLFWSIVYAVNNALFNQLTWEQVITKVINGNGHMWFIITILSIYIAVPVLRCITRNEQVMRYFLLVSFLSVIVAKTLLFTFSPLISNQWLSLLLSSFQTNYQVSGIGSLLGYIFYFVLGYYINSREQTKAERTIAYIGTLIGFLATMVLTQYASGKLGYKYISFYGDHTINVLLQSVGVFVLIKNIKWNFGSKLENGLRILSKWSFGIYLVHELCIGKLAAIGIHVWAFHPIISVPFVSVSVFVVSAIVSAILNQIPVIRKYIV